MLHKELSAVVVGVDHYNTLNVVRALGEDRVKPLVMLVGNKPKSFVLKSKYIEKSYITSEDRLVDDLIKKYAREGEKIPLLTVCDSLSAIIDESFDRLSQFFIVPSIGNISGELIRCMDKERQLIHARKAGFEVPSSITLNLKNNFRNTIDSVRFPCLIKPAASIGGSKNDFRIINCKESLTNNLNELAGHIDNVLVQDFIPNDEVILIAGVRTMQGDNYLLGEVNKTKHGKKTNNLGLNCFGVWSIESELVEKCKYLVDDIDYYGCYSIDVVRLHTDEGDVLNYFMEINLRTDGLLYFYTKAGINFPAIWVKSCYGLPIKISPKKTKVYGMNEFLYIKNSLSWSVFKDVFKADVFSTFSLSDVKPFLYRLKYHNNE